MTELTHLSGIRLGVGADELGAPLKDYLVTVLANDSRLATVRDFSEAEADPSCPYPVVALRVAQAVAHGEIDRGILVCGTGIGMSITANKVPGVHTAVVHDVYSAERSVLSNNCQIMTLGARIIADVLPTASFRNGSATSSTLDRPRPRSCG